MYTRKQTIYFSIILLRFKVVLFSLAKSHSSVCQRKEREKKKLLKKCPQKMPSKPQAKPTFLFL